MAISPLIMITDHKPIGEIRRIPSSGNEKITQE
jgi:hypothetical protein